jgi:hypothetical protein
VGTELIVNESRTRQWSLDACSFLIKTPVIWAIFSAFFFWHVGGLLDRINWNVIEMMIGRNLLSGNGYIVAPLDPPAIWRPVFTPFLCAVIEIFTKDPFLIFKIMLSASLTTLIISSFYIMKETANLKAAHISAYLIISCPAFFRLLIDGSHTFSHIGFLLVIGPCMYFTCIMINRRKHYLALISGLLWGLTYLARPETLLFYVVTLLMSVIAFFPKEKLFFKAKFVLISAAAFMIAYAPYQVFIESAAHRFGLFGQSPIITFYNSEGWVAFYNSESWTRRGPSVDVEGEGYKVALKKYGSLEDNDFSLIKTVSRHPHEFINRLKVNSRKFYAIYFDRLFFNPGLFSAIPLLLLYLFIYKRQVRWSLYLALLFLASAITIIFHISPRYLIIGVPFLLFLVSAGFACGFEMALEVSDRIGYKKLLILPLICLLVCTISYVSHSKANVLKVFSRTNKSHRFTGEILGKAFLKHNIKPGVLSVLLPMEESRLDWIDTCLVSYYSGTPVDWRAFKAPEYPREKIFSYKKKKSDYVYVPEEDLYTMDILRKHTPIYGASDPVLGRYYLFQGSIESLRESANRQSFREDLI